MKLFKPGDIVVLIDDNYSYETYQYRVINYFPSSNKIHIAVHHLRTSEIWTTQFSESSLQLEIVANSPLMKALS